MSAADDRMAVRTPSGYRSIPRRAALGMIATGRATAARRAVPAPRETGIPARGKRITVDVPRGDAIHEVTGVVTPAGQPLPEAVSEPGPPGEPVTALADDVDDSPGGGFEAVRGPVEYPQVPRGNASREAWAEYAQAVGVIVSDDMTRNAVRDAVKNGTGSVRLSQPARKGGRLANPEDEPVTEAVTSGNPGIE